MGKATNHSSNTQTTKTGVTTTRLIRAVHTDDTVRLYQAYNNDIADLVVKAQSFQPAAESGLWSTHRMTWIKPSKVWMAYRCGWTVLKDSNQSRVLAIDIDRSKFEELLEQAVLSEHNGKNKRKCRDSSVVVQWDPERVMNKNASEGQVLTRPLPMQRSIQIGLRPPANKILLDPQVVKKITDVTEDFRAAAQALQDKDVPISEATRLLWPGGQTETVLEVPQQVRANLHITETE